MNKTRRQPGSITRRATALVAASLALLLAAAQDTPEEKAAPDAAEAAVAATSIAPRPTILIPVALPIRGTVDIQVKQSIDRALADYDDAAVRPLVILEFKGEQGQTGTGSEFERCLSLARFLVSERLSRARTIAYLPQDLEGHAVLPVLACEEVVIDAEASFGAAGVNETHVDETVRSAYRETAERRRTIPVAVALGMLDRELAVYQAQTLDGVSYVLEAELEPLKQRTAVREIQRIIQPGDLGRFNGRDLRLRFGFASHLASNRSQLASELGIAVADLEGEFSKDGSWRPVQVDFDGPVTAKAVNWIIRSTQARVSEQDRNFICVSIRSPGGSAEDSLRLADYLASLDPSKVRTVALVTEEALSDAVLVAFACDHLVVSEEAKLGGPGAVNLAERDREELHRAVKVLAASIGRDWSLAAGLVDPKLEVFRCTQEGSDAVRYLSAEELAEQSDPSLWRQDEVIDLAGGLSGREAEKMQWVTHVADDMDALRAIYQLEELERVRPNWAHLLVEKLASPKLAGIILFIAWFALFVEFSQPGLGIGGFVASLCFLLFFWSNFLHGTAGWLEVLLFTAGLISLAMEFFVVPGFGVFGFGGAMLIVGSMVLASQTFVIPQNAYQLHKMPSSLMMAVAAGAGLLTSMVMLRRYIHDAPLLKHIALAPRDEDELEELDRRESITDYDYLEGKRGRTTTPLTPSGKAQFGDQVVNVISDGELVPRATDVWVAEVRGNRVLVKTSYEEFGE